MKSLKEQLGELRATSRGAGRDQERAHGSPRSGFQPPASWLAADASIPKNDGGSTNIVGAIHVGASIGDGRHDGAGHRDDSTGRKPTGSPVTSKALRAPVGNPSSRPGDVVATPFRPRIEEGCPLSMPDWGEAGRSLQHPEHHGGKATPMTVRIGVDFGTAFTKVAMRAGVEVIPVEWSAVTESDAAGDTTMGRYVIPGVVARRSDGEYRWQRRGEDMVQGNLKLPVIEKAEANACPTATVAYLALVIRYARAFLYQRTEVGRKLMGRSLRWELNIGCPTKPHENPTIVRAFQRIARTAWQVAAWKTIHESDIETAWNARRTDIGLETEPTVVPEFVAQIAGYLASPQAGEGLHALIDVGAATLDVATFNVVIGKDRTSLPRIPIFFSAVQPLGTHYLRHHRHSRLGLKPAWNDATPVETADVFGERNGKSASEVVAVDAGFTDQIVRCITHVIDGTRTNRRGDPCSPAWRDGLPIFVTGGGAKCRLYRQAIEEAQSQLILRVGQRPDGARRFRFIELNSTSGDVRDGVMDRRLTVALGLTEDAENIARVVPHRDIEPLVQGLRERVDPTELYGDR